MGGNYEDETPFPGVWLLDDMDMLVRFYTRLSPYTTLTAHDYYSLLNVATGEGEEYLFFYRLVHVIL